MEIKAISNVAKKLNITESQVKVVVELLNTGSTVPFISRYRKGMTGGLNEEVIESINSDFNYFVELNKRKESIIEILKENDLLTKELEQEIIKSETKSDLESIYEPFKEGKKTKASQAISLGLEPLAKEIFNSANEDFNPISEARKYLSDNIPTIDFAIEQSSLIIAQWMSQDIKVRKLIKEQIINYGFIVTKKKKNAQDEKEKFSQYYEYKEPIKKIPNHRILAISRGESLKIISNKLEYNNKKIRYDLNNYFFKVKRTGKIILDSLEDALKRLILPSVEREVWKSLRERAEIEAIKLFSNNLEEMLLAPAIKKKTILAIDPAFASGCKIAVLSPQGDVLEISLIKPNPPFNKTKESEDILNKLIDKHKVDIIVIGNGTASRETEIFVSSIVKKRNDDISFIVISEAGASVYSASKIAIEEFPNLSVEQRSAIHLGRKFQDPLNELVKIDPKSIGIGQYQHDVNQKELGESLNLKVNKVVNLVGVDLNTATEQILTYVSGISKGLAKKIIDYRTKNGSFKNREELKNVEKLGKKSFEQAVGFLRIMDSENFFDKTKIHPESYELASKIVQHLSIDLENIDVQSLKNVDVKELCEKLKADFYDVQLIIESLISPNKDIRDEKSGPILKKDVLTIDQIKVGDVFEGSIQNITDFGVFVYIGIKQSVLVHISNLSDSFVKHPSDIFKTGQHVSVEIIGIEKERDRIQGKIIN